MQIKTFRLITLLLLTYSSITFAAEIYTYCPPADAIECENSHCHLNARYTFDWALEYPVNQTDHSWPFLGATLDRNHIATCRYSNDWNNGIKLVNIQSLSVPIDASTSNWNEIYGTMFCRSNDRGTCPFIYKYPA